MKVLSGMLITAMTYLVFISSSYGESDDVVGLLKDKNNHRIPIICDLNYVDKDNNDRGVSKNVLLIIDENKKLILNYDDTLFAENAIITETNISFESITKPNAYTVIMDINRLDGNVTGELKVKEFIKIEGKCKRRDLEK